MLCTPWFRCGKLYSKGAKGSKRKNYPPSDFQQASGISDLQEDEQPAPKRKKKKGYDPYTEGITPIAIRKPSRKH